MNLGPQGLGAPGTPRDTAFGYGGGPVDTGTPV